MFLHTEKISLIMQTRVSIYVKMQQLELVWLKLRIVMGYWHPVPLVKEKVHLGRQFPWKNTVQNYIHNAESNISI